MSQRYQSAILGGLFIGIVSSLPLIGALNVCCCLWVVAGGLLAMYLRQQQLPVPIETSEALLVGLLAGVIGAVLNTIGSWALLSWTGPVWQDQIRSQIQANAQLSPAMQDWLLRLLTGQGVILIQFAVSLPVYAVFSSLGSLLGLAFFRKKVPPAPPLPPAPQS